MDNSLPKIDIIEKENVIWTIDVDHRSFPMTKVVQHIVEKYEQALRPPTTIEIPTYGLDLALIDQLRRVGLPVIGIKPKHVK